MNAQYQKKMKQDLILPDGFNVSNFYIKHFHIHKKKEIHFKNSHTYLCFTSFIYNKDFQ